MRYSIRSPRNGVEIGNQLLITLICFAFAVICPPILPLGVGYFIGMWIFWRCAQRVFFVCAVLCVLCVFAACAQSWRVSATLTRSPKKTTTTTNKNSYQLIFNYQRKYESGGLMWPFMVNRTLLCAAIMVGFTGLVCAAAVRHTVACYDGAARARPLHHALTHPQSAPNNSPSQRHSCVFVVKQAFTQAVLMWVVGSIFLFVFFT